MLKKMLTMRSNFVTMNLTAWSIMLKGVTKMARMEDNTEDLMMKSLVVDSEEYIHFLKLDEEKQKRILAVAYDEFLEKGYGEASTNVITQKAGISKGGLFHYFGNKEGLYKFLIKESARRIASETMSELPLQNGDVFSSIKSIVQLKIKVCLLYPKETTFLIAMWGEHLPKSLLQECENMVGMSDNYLEILFGLLDGSLLRDGVEKNIATEIIAWVCEKYTDKMLSSGVLTAEMESLEYIANDLDKYMNVLRHGLYKE